MNQTVARWNAATREMMRAASIAAEVIDHYTSLGAFKPRRAERFVPYAVRVAYAGSGRHHVSRSAQPLAWVRSRLRDLGDALWGAWTTPEEARS